MDKQIGLVKQDTLTLAILERDKRISKERKEKIEQARILSAQKLKEREMIKLNNKGKAVKESLCKYLQKIWFSNDEIATHFSSLETTDKNTGQRIYKATIRNEQKYQLLATVSLLPLLAPTYLSFLNHAFILLEIYAATAAIALLDYIVEKQRLIKGLKQKIIELEKPDQKLICKDMKV